MEAALVDLAGELDGFFAVSGELLCIADTAGGLRRLNATWERELGFGREDLVGRSLLDLVHAEDLDVTRAAFAQLSARYSAVTFTTRCRTKQGAYRWLAWRAQASNGLIYAAAQDITDRRSLEDAVRSATAAAEAARSARTTFLARVNHEFRTPVTAIVGLCKLALSTQLTPRQRDYLAKLQAHAYALSNLTSNLQDFSLLKSGDLVIEHVVFRLDHLLAAVASTASPRAQEKGLALVVNAGPDVPRRLLGDSLRIGQVLSNLLANAVKFTERGQVSLSAELHRKTATGVTVRFAVRDTGAGMDPSRLGQAAEPFGQAGSGDRRGDGALGLSISWQVVALMGGTLHADSQPGSETTTFWFDLDFGVPPRRGPTTRVLPLELAGRRILVADAARVDRDATAEGLSALGFAVTTVDSGQAALKELTSAEVPYDAVFVDGDLPAMGSLEVVRQLRSDLHLPVTPRIILMMGSGPRPVLEQLERFSLDGALIKPLSPSDLFDTLMAAMGREVEATAPESHSGAESSRRLLSGLRVLVVEDNAINQRVARELLQSRGVLVEVVGNGREAIDTLQSDPRRFDAVLMDVQMPVMDGYEATRAIRQHWPDLVLPVIAVTANALRSEQAACLEAGMNDYLAKPINPKRLEAVLRHWTHLPLSEQAATAEEQRVPGTEGSAQLQASGVDVASALARLNGDMALLVRLLRMFAREHEHAGEAIADALRRGDIETAAGLTHALKGVAGTLSVTTVYEVTRELEMAIRQAPGDAHGRHLEHLDAALAAVCQAVRALGDPATPRSESGVRVPAQAGRLAALVAEFDLLLKKRRFSARGQFDQIKEHATATELRERLDEIQTCLDHLDFQRARDLLPGLSRALGVSFTPA